MKIELNKIKDDTFDKETKGPLFIGNQQDLSRAMEKLVSHPIQNLFIWALLLDRIEIAKIFWMIGHV